MLTSFYYNKEVEKHSQNLKYAKFSYSSKDKKYFLICEDCFWMASTIQHPSEYPLISYRKCPICKNKVDRFQIPNRL
jgi:hypothetical protein